MAVDAVTRKGRSLKTSSWVCYIHRHQLSGSSGNWRYARGPHPPLSQPARVKTALVKKQTAMPGAAIPAGLGETSKSPRCLGTRATNPTSEKDVNDHRLASRTATSLGRKPRATDPVAKRSRQPAFYRPSRVRSSAGSPPSDSSRSPAHPEGLRPKGR